MGPDPSTLSKKSPHHLALLIDFHDFQCPLGFESNRSMGILVYNSPGEKGDYSAAAR